MKVFKPVAYRIPLMILPLILVVLLAISGIALGASPYLAYVYPAGGQKGTTFTVTIGGQNLKGTTAAVVTGPGVTASVVGYVGSGGPISVIQEEELKRQIDYLINKAAGKNVKLEPSTVKLPDLPDLRNLSRKSVDELKEIKDKYTNRSRRPVSPMAEEVTLQVTIDPVATAGSRELRLRTSSGYSNPVVFQVSGLREISEPIAALDKGTNRIAAPDARVPVVFNGQIMPGDVDRFPLQLRAGQKLMAVAYARALIPYLADAVPGWFQAVLALYDADGREVAHVDDFGYDPDPILTYEVPKTGRYYLEIHDAVYRGRRDFVYRIAVGDARKPLALLPSGSRGGVQFSNGTTNKATVSTEADFFSAWTTIPTVTEKEVNDSSKQAERISLPQVVRGNIAKDGDVDYYQISGKAGEEIVAEVLARRDGSPLDSLVRLLDANGKVLAWNDDKEDKNFGLLTHHADSYIKYRLPETGIYTLQVSDAQGHGSPNHTYSLRVSQPMPDFSLWIAPSALNISSGKTAVISVDVIRTDGFDGEIEVALKDAPTGFVLDGGKIPAGRNQIRMTITTASNSLTELQFEGRAVIGGKTVIRPVRLADKMMQAFAYYHLVPTVNTKLSLLRSTTSSMTICMPTSGVTRIPAGGTAEVICNISPMPTASIRLELREPPAGIAIKETRVVANGVILVLAADSKYVGYADNLIVEVFTDTETPGKDGAPAVIKTASLGLLPAIPILVVP